VKSITENACDAPGVFEIIQAAEYSRYRGVTNVLYIGRSNARVRGELMNTLRRHTIRNRLDRIRGQTDAKVFFRFQALSAEQARLLEGVLLRSFEQEHWEIPVLNSQRGYARDEDHHFRLGSP
jgi:predicted nucleic acid-binding protein